MSTFTVCVRTGATRVIYSAIGATSIDVHTAAVDRFGPCAITVTPSAQVGA